MLGFGTAPRFLFAAATIATLTAPSAAQPILRTPDFGEVVAIPITFGSISLAQEDSFRSAELYREVTFSHFGVSESPKDATRATTTARVSRIGEDANWDWNPDDFFATHDVFLNDFRPTAPGFRATYFYGARVIESRDRFAFHATSHPTRWSPGNLMFDTRAQSLWVGPEAGMSASVTVGRLALESRFSSMLAYSDHEYSQYGWLGEDTTPSRYNQPLYIAPSTFAHTGGGESMSYVGELRLSANYWLSANSRLSVVWSNSYLSAVHTALNQVRYALKEDGGVMGFRAENGQSAWLDSLQLSLIVTR